MLNKKCDGYSLTEVLLSIAISVVGIAAISAVYISLKKSEIHLTEKLNSNEFISALTKKLTSQKGCEESLSGLPVPTASPQNISISNYKSYGAPASGILAAGTKLSNLMSIQRLTIKDKGIAPYDVIVSGVSYRRLIAQVHLSLSLTTSGATENFDKYIELPILTKVTGPGGTIDVCGLESTTAEVCAAMGGAFTSPNICTPASTCDYMGMSYGCPGNACPGANFPSARYFALASGATSNPPVSAACPRGGTPTSTGYTTYSYTTGSGKTLATHYNDAYFYICLQCI